jgi:two-component system sensor histidine kinase/response regulator
MVFSVASAPALFLGAVMGDSGWFQPLFVAVVVSAIGLLAWQLWRSQRHYAAELAEQSRQIAEEQEQANQARQAQETLARESQAKSEMLATLSREIRAHLNGIIGSADLMLDNPLKPQQREHLTTLRASAESLHQSLNDVLDYSSIETGHLQIARAPLDLRRPLIEVVEALSPLALLKNLELVLIVAPDVPLQISGDAARLRQIFLNLMANAVKFTATGRVVLRVELATGSSPPPPPGATWLHFSVTDTSAGIPADMHATIFERAAGSASSAPRKFGGSGLDLAISKRLAELMGGRIGARSLPEGGSEFWVDLALSADKAPPSALPAPLSGLHVVVLDPLAASRISASALLTRLGVDHDATDTVAEAAVLLRDALDEDARELVLLVDESAAKNGGDELTKLLAPDSSLRSTRLVLMSRTPEEAAAAASHFPVAAVMRKPLLRAEVLADALRTRPGTGAIKVIDSRALFEVGTEARPAARRGPHVLVVDDDHISRSVSSQILGLLGCVVELAVSGAEAIELTQSTHFDLILMDLQMPVMDGYTTTERIRAATAEKAPPIVALTANTSDADREKCFAAGMCDFIGKPVHKTDLARILQRWAPAK